MANFQLASTTMIRPVILTAALGGVHIVEYLTVSARVVLHGSAN